MHLDVFSVFAVFMFGMKFSGCAAVMRSSGFRHLKENCPSLQSELLKIIAGAGDESSDGGKDRSVWAQLSDGGDSSGRRVRPRL